MSKSATFEQVSPEEVGTLLHKIQWAWNTRDADGLRDVYWERAVIAHPNKVFHGIEQVYAYYRALCLEPEQMGFMSLRATEIATGFTNEGDALVQVAVACRVLDSRFRWVSRHQMQLRAVRQGVDLRVIEDTEFPAQVQSV